MPKSSKKRKEKAADFSKAKLKLGKGKQKATNAIDTSFKARSIALPTQSITINKDEETPTTKRKLTFEDLIAHLRHYNPSTRKDAILGLRELLESYPQTLESSLPPLIKACVRIIGDEDAMVRNALLSLFTWLLPQISSEHLIPHSPLLLLFTSSAQTHIFPEICIDAIRFLDLFLKYLGPTVTNGWHELNGEHGSRILGGYLGILNAGTKLGESQGEMRATSTASVVLSPKSKLVVLKSLSTFLQTALSMPSSDDIAEGLSTSLPTWYLAPSFPTHGCFEAFDKILQPLAFRSSISSKFRLWKDEVENDDDDFVHNFAFALGSIGTSWSLQSLSHTASIPASTEQSDTHHERAFLTRLASTLQPTIVSTFLDCAPAVFSPSSSPSATELDLIMTVAEITHSLYGASTQGLSIINHSPMAAEDLQHMLEYMTPYFPFKSGGERDVRVEQALQSLNVIFCELTSLVILASETHLNKTPLSRRGRIRQGRAGSQNSKASFSTQGQLVTEHILKLLKGEANAGLQTGRSLSPAAYIGLLPTLWATLNNASQTQQSGEVFHTVIHHSMKTSTKSALKKPTIEFVARIVLLQTEAHFEGGFWISKSLEDFQILKEWIMHLPKALWELASSNLPLTEIILRFLLCMFARKSSLLTQDTLESLCSRLIPYFHVKHATRGELSGPYCRLPMASPTRRLALDVVISCALLNVKCQNDLWSAVDQAVIGSREEAYWKHLRAL